MKAAEEAAEGLKGGWCKAAVYYFICWEDLLRRCEVVVVGVVNAELLVV